MTLFPQRRQVNEFMFKALCCPGIVQLIIRARLEGPAKSINITVIKPSIIVGTLELDNNVRVT